jgi:ABC-type phosphate transport system substrate-binding protein
MGRVLIGMVMLTLGIYAKNLVLIANKHTPIAHLTADDIKAIYLKKRTYWHNVKLVPLNLPPENTLRRQFEQEVLGMDGERLQRYWTREHYLGHRPPFQVKTPESVVAFVTKVRGAVGYVPEEMANEGVTILYRLAP